MNSCLLFHTCCLFRYQFNVALTRATKNNNMTLVRRAGRDSFDALMHHQDVLNLSKSLNVHPPERTANALTMPEAQT
jgi:hypothetical protein